MSYVFLEVKTIHSKNGEEFHILYLLDTNNLVVQKIFVPQNKLDVLKTYSMFDDISDLVTLTYKYNSYQLALR